MDISVDASGGSLREVRDAEGERMPVKSTSNTSWIRLRPWNPGGYPPFSGRRVAAISNGMKRCRTPGTIYHRRVSGYWREFLWRCEGRYRRNHSKVKAYRMFVDQMRNNGGTFTAIDLRDWLGIHARRHASSSSMQVVGYLRRHLVDLGVKVVQRDRSGHRLTIYAVR